MIRGVYVFLIFFRFVSLIDSALNFSHLIRKSSFLVVLFNCIVTSTRWICSVAIDLGRIDMFMRVIYFVVVGKGWVISPLLMVWGHFISIHSSRWTRISSFCVGNRIILSGWIMLSERGKFISVSKEPWFACDFCFFFSNSFDLFILLMILFLKLSFLLLLS